MSIWHKEIVRINGDLMAYIEVQNDYTGQIRGGLRNIYLKDNEYYCTADGKKIILNVDRERFLMHEDKVKSALKWYAETKF